MHQYLLNFGRCERWVLADVGISRLLERADAMLFRSLRLRIWMSILSYYRIKMPVWTCVNSSKGDFLIHACKLVSFSRALISFGDNCKPGIALTLGGLSTTQELYAEYILITPKATFLCHSQNFKMRLISTIYGEVQLDTTLTCAVPNFEGWNFFNRSLRKSTEFS